MVIGYGGCFVAGVIVGLVISGVIVVIASLKVSKKEKK